MTIIHISHGGSMRKISVDGKIYEFEMHPYCGPCLLNKKGNPIDLRKTPIKFLEAVSLWVQQGQLIEDDLCRWGREPEEILEHLGGKHYRIVGYKEPVRGE